MNLAWRGTILQCLMIVGLLSLALVSMLLHVSESIQMMLVGAFCTGFGALIGKARTDVANYTDGSGVAISMRPPPRVPPSQQDTPLRRAIPIALTVASLVFLLFRPR